MRFLCIYLFEVNAYCLDLKLKSEISIDWENMREKIRVCMLIVAPFPLKGGAEIFTYELSQALSKKGCNVTIVCETSGNNESEITENTVRICPILKSGKMGFFENFFSFFRFLCREKFDIVHAHFVIPTGSVALLAKLFRTPVIITSHGVDIMKYKVVRYGARLSRILSMIIWVTLKIADLHVVASKSMVKDAMEAGSSRQKIEVVRPGFNLKKISSSGGANILQRYKIGDNFVLFLGRLTPKKCPQDLLKAFSKVVERVHDVKLVFAGRGVEMENLRKLTVKFGLEDRVIFTGFVTEDEKWDLLKNCRVFVLPSVAEGYPKTVIEATACGKPVIATNLGPFPEIIKDHETGLLVSPHSPNRLADAILELTLNEKKRIEMGIKASKNIEQFSIDKNADDYLLLYKRLIKQK